jgi:hypothetical protein
VVDEVDDEVVVDEVVVDEVVVDEVDEVDDEVGKICSL